MKALCAVLTVVAFCLFAASTASASQADNITLLVNPSTGNAKIWFHETQTLSGYQVDSGYAGDSWSDGDSLLPENWVPLAGRPGLWDTNAVEAATAYAISEGSWGEATIAAGTMLDIGNIYDPTKPRNLYFGWIDAAGNAYWEFNYGIYPPTFYDGKSVEYVPEPSTIIILLQLGICGIAYGWWRRRKAA